MQCLSGNKNFSSKSRKGSPGDMRQMVPIELQSEPSSLWGYNSGQVSDYFFSL